MKITTSIFKIVSISLLFSLTLNAQKIILAVASNISFAIKPLIKEFNKTNKTKVIYTIGSSGKLTAQIKNRAPFDIFLSANMKYPNYLYEDKIAILKPKIYAKGSLVLFSYKDRNLKDLTILDNVRKIAVANDKTAPYGKATREFLENKNLYEKFKKKLVFAENISQTLQYTMSAADLGFIAKASLSSKKMKKFKEKINYINLDTRFYTPIKQGIALLNNKKESKDFYEFISSTQAKKILKEYGYEVN